jgi:signal transduction histidine kinase
MSRGQPGSAAVIDVGGAIEAVNRLIEPTARAHSVRVEVGQPSEPIHVRADEAEFQNALINLLLNAVQACQPGGRVAIAAGRSDGHLRIRVSDNGCGIAAENRTHIFEPFFSLRKGGTGLGLFLTLNFVRRCGGDISVESAPGEGAAFEIVLPALVPEAAQ